MDAVSNHVPKINGLLGPLSMNLFASRLSSQIPVYVSRPSCSGHRCLHIGLELPSREIVCKLSLGSDKQSPVTHSHTRSSGASIGSTSLEGSSMVSFAPLNADQSTNSHPAVTRDNANSMSEQSTRHHPTVSCVGYIRKQCEGSHLSQTATDLVLSSWIDKFTKLYNFSFDKWAHWCSKRDRDPLSGPISDVANFLADLFEQGYQYSSLNAYRSAISSTHERVNGLPVGQHPTIVTILKGAYNKRPLLPKYSTT